MKRSLVLPHIMPRVAIAFLSFLLLASVAKAEVIFNTQFTSNAQSLPNNLLWIKNSSSLTASFNQPGMMLKSASSATEIISYFTDTDKVAALDVGQTLTLSFTVTATGMANAGGAFRFGLFNSEETARQKTTNSAFAASSYTGYFIATSLRSSAAGATSVVARDPSLDRTELMYSNNLITDDTTIFKSAGSNLGAAATFDVVFSLTNLGESGTKIEYTIGSVSDSYTDALFHYTSFDSIGLAIRNSQFPNGLTISGMSLTLTSIPEPSQAGLLGTTLLCGLGVLWFCKKN